MRYYKDYNSFTKRYYGLCLISQFTYKVQLDFQTTSEDIRRLSYKVVKILIERTGADLKVPVNFEEVYNEACSIQGGINDEHNESNMEIRHHVRDNLISQGHIFMDSKDVESIYITQKAIDEYADY